VSKGLVRGDLNALPGVGGDKGTEFFGVAAREINDGPIALPAVIVTSSRTLKVQSAH
jgi:uncharacterized protein (UPF0261 family)